MIALLMGRSLMKGNIITFHKVKYKKYHNWVTYLIWVGYFVEFLYFGNLPLLAIFTKVPMDYTKFGIPTFHVFLVTFNSFYAVYLFQLLLSKVKEWKKVLMFYILNLIPSMLIMNRGMLIMIIVSCLFVFLIKNQKKITLRIILGITVIMLIGMYLFGVAGNVRVNNMYKTNTSLLDNNLFLQIGGATKEFRDSPIPKEFFWSYIYIASPLANLEKTIDDYKLKEDVSASDSFTFTVTQLLPDFIGKRIVALYDITVPQVVQITPELNVATAFALPYVLLGWVGISVFTLFIFGFAFLYIFLLKRMNSEFFVVGVAILNTIFVFNTFSNMFSFTGLSFQLFYPLLFTLFSVKKVNPQVFNPGSNSISRGSTN